MSSISVSDKYTIYEETLPQIDSLLEGENNLIANFANICAVLKTTFNWFWVGFYLPDLSAKEKQLVLGPFQGPVACTRIPYGRGVCGQAWEQQKIIVVEDVHTHPDHIACSALSQSEIVVPIFNDKQQLLAILDVDADVKKCFDNIDMKYLGELAKLIIKHNSKAV